MNAEESLIRIRDLEKIKKSGDLELLNSLMPLKGLCVNDTIRDALEVMKSKAREFDSWISEKSTCRSHKTCFFCVKFLVFIYCILLQCVVKYNKGGILHASYYIEI